MIKNDFPKILESYFNRHLKLERQFSENTYTTYLSVLSQYIDYLKNTKGLSPDQISIEHFEKTTTLDFLNYAESTLNCSTRTRNHKLTVINSFLEYAQSLNPVYIRVYLENKSIKMKRVVKEKQDFMAIEELEAFFRSINIKTKDGYKHYVLFTVLYETGARVSELIQIKIEHIEIGYFDLYTKGGKLRRLYIPKKLRTETLEWLGENNRSSGYLFLNRYGDRITTRGISQQLKNYADKYGLDKKVVYPHSFRHRYAKNFLEKYNDIALLADLMGHESIETTRIYLRRTASEQQALVDKIVTW